MDEQGLWKLFFATGSPLVWLAIRNVREERMVWPLVAELPGETRIKIVK